MSEIYVDADACPVKEEVVRVAERHGMVVHMVSDGGVRPHRSRLVRLVVVAQGADAADDWIAEHIGQGDVCVTADIPLAARCIENGAKVLRPNGEALDERSIGMVLASRDLMTTLRETGTVSGGPAPFSSRDRSRFLSALENIVRG